MTLGKQLLCDIVTDLAVADNNNFHLKFHPIKVIGKILIQYYSFLFAIAIAIVHN